MKYTLLILLTRVGDSIRKLELKNDLKIEAINEDSIQTNFKFLGKDSLGIAHHMWEGDILNFKTNKVYVITKSFEFEEDPKHPFKSLNEFGTIQKEIIFGYVDPLITKLRLFKEGNIGYLKYYFYNKNGSFASTLGSNFATEWGEDYELTEDETKKLNIFLENIKIPQGGRLKIAIDNFNQSYSKVNYELQFLSLMMSMEALYSKNPVEATFRLTRNCAILIGETKDEAESIYGDFKRMYDIRSDIIHGRIKGIDFKEIIILRAYVRKSIVRYLLVNKNPDVIIAELDKLGFGDYNKI